MNEPDFNTNVSYIVHEGILARMERANKRLFICLIILIVTILATNAYWLYEWTQYDYVSEETTTNSHDVDLDGDGTANYIGNNGNINGTHTR